MSIQPLNFWSQARRTITEYAAGPFDEAIIQTLIRMGDHAVKFMLPDNGKLVDRSYPQVYDDDDLPLLQLPYPAILLEYAVTAEVENKDMETESTKRLALVVDSSTFFKAIAHIAPSDVISEAAKAVTQYRGIVVVAISYYDINGKWVVMPSYAHIDLNAVADGHIDPNQKSNIRSNIGVRMVPLLCETHDLMERNGVTYSSDLSSADLISEVNAVFDLIQIFQCSNVKHQSINTVKEAVNRKRLAAGKVPLYEYKVLTVELQGQRTISDAHGESDRRSPREHLRRGHIRRLQSGHRTWIQPCVVGSRAHGVIDKDYAIGFDH